MFEKPPPRWWFKIEIDHSSIDKYVPCIEYLCYVCEFKLYFFGYRQNRGCRQVAERCSRSKILRCVFRKRWTKTEISNIQLSCIRISSAHLVNQKKWFRVKYWLGKNGILIFMYETFHENEMNVKQPAFQPMVDYYSTCWLLQVAMSRMEKQTSWDGRKHHYLSAQLVATWWFGTQWFGFLRSPYERE